MRKNSKKNPQEVSMVNASQGAATGLNSNSVSDSYNSGEQTTDNDAAFAAFEFSNKFLCSKAKIPSEGLIAGDYISKITTKNPKEKLNLMSDIFKDITTVPKYEKGLSQYITKQYGLTVINGNIGDYIIKVVKKHYGISDPSCASDNEQAISDKKYLLYLKGPVGCYKNRLLEYVYLTLCADEKLKDVPIFYINFTKYEGKYEGMTETIEGDIKEIINILPSEGSNTEKPPLFILEGIRGFYFGQNETIYNSYVEFLRNRSCKIIASRDIDFNRLTSRKYDLPFFGTSQESRRDDQNYNYQNRLSITSLNITRQKESLDFIKDCVYLFEKIDDLNLCRESLRYYFSQQYQDRDDFLAESFYNKLRKLSIYTLDAYQLRLILKKLSSESTDRYQDSGLTIFDVYQNMGFNESIFSKAFEYEYKRDFSIDAGQQNDWYNIIKHKDLLDYCISRYYCTLLDQELGKDEAKRKYNLPNVPFSKSVTRFIVPSFCGDDRLVSYVQEHFNKCKENISCNIGRFVQLFYLCGRAKNDNITLATNLLNSIKNVLPTLTEYTKINAGMAFLLRAVYTNLIFLEDSKAAQKYFTELLKGEDNIHVNTNIGFHLDYYGDARKAFIESCTPKYSEIGVTKCLNTLRALTIDLGQNITNEEIGRPLVTILQLITYCQILERRDFELRGIGAQSEDFLENLCTWLQTIIGKLFVESSRESVKSYFQKILKRITLQQQINNLFTVEEYEKVIKYNTYSQLHTIGRTGWIMRGINGGYKKIGDKWKKSVYIAENVAEHTLNSWLLGYIFLPEDANNEDANNNNKQKILELLLVHDFAKIKVGDIVRKKQNIKFLENELKYMQDFLGTETPVYKAWCDVWGSTGNDSVLKVARDIDRIQAVYQYFRYYCETKKGKKVIENDEKTVNEWLNELDRLTTNLGKNIAKCVILCNAVFLEQSELIEKFSAVLKKMFPSDSRQ